MSGKLALNVMVHGRVQGVHFRMFVQRQARMLGLTGYVRNLSGGRLVEVRAEGEEERLEELVRLLHIGPDGARVERVDVEWPECAGAFNEFEVRY